MNQLRRASSLSTHTLPSLTRFNSTMKFLALITIVLLALAGAQNVKAQGDDPINLDVPGQSLEPSAAPSDQKPGSVLIYPIYTSLASAPNTQNTRINITNIDVRRGAFVHLFFVDGNSCNVGDAFVCLTANQTMSFIASDLDPGVTGFLIAIAVNAIGCPINFNALIGDAFVKFGTGHAANLGAIAVSALPGLSQTACTAATTVAAIRFNGTAYNRLPRTVAADNIPDRASGNDTLLVLDRINGNLATGADDIGEVFGLLYDDSESVLSFNFSPGSCQFRGSITNNFPRTTPRFGTFVPAGRSGWMRLYRFGDGALVGATLNTNPNTATAPGAFRQGHNLHTLTLTSAAVLTIPIFPPSC